MLKPTSWNVAPGLFLVCQSLSPAAAPLPKPEPVDHIAMVDASGSMWGDLPRIRASLKAKWATLLNPGDTLTLAWFSGRGQCGVLFEAVEPTLANQAGIDRAIDKLQPVGMTGFKDPLVLIGEILGRITKTRGAKPNASLFFMTDGCDNEWPRQTIIDEIRKVAGDLASTVLVAYGYYADIPLLNRMAEAAGGTVINATDFRDYEPTFEKAMRKGSKGGPKKQSVVLDATPIGDFVYALDGGEILTFGVDAVSGGRAGVVVPSHITEIYYLSEVTVGKAEQLSNIAGLLGAAANTSQDQAAGRIVRGADIFALPAAYAAVSLFSLRINPKIVWSILRTLGDVRLIDDFSLCIGKQRYATFVQTTKDAAFGEGRYVRGYDPKRAPREDAFSILDVISLLESNDACRILTESDAFIYSRIGRKAVDKSAMVTITEGKAVADLADEMKARAATREVGPMKETLEALSAIILNRKQPLKFKVDDATKEKGCSILKIGWTADVPNVTFTVKKMGTVDISEATDLPPDLAKILPPVIRTYIFRSYAMIKDGLVHIDALPVIVPQNVFDKLVAEGVFDPNVEPAFKEGDDWRIVIDFKKLPVLNQLQVRAASAKTMAELQWRLLTLKGEAKVWNHYEPARESKGFAQVFGAPAAKWLDEHNITDHSGFKIDSTSAPPTDHYIGRRLEVKIAGFSGSLPKVEEVRERMAALSAPPEPAEKGKKVKAPKEVTPLGKLMVQALNEVDAFRASPIFINAADKDALFVKWVSDKAKATTAETRKVQAAISRQAFATLVGQAWFAEFGTSFDNNKLDVVLGGEKREVTFALDENYKIQQ